jgi:hypothetical protein
MRESSELAETSAVLFQQLNKLQIRAIRTGVGIFDDPNDAMEIWLTTLTHSQEVIGILDYVNLHIHPVFENIIPARKQKKSFAFTQLTGAEVIRLCLPTSHCKNKVLSMTRSIFILSSLHKAP